MNVRYGYPASDLAHGQLLLVVQPLLLLSFDLFLYVYEKAADLLALIKGPLSQRGEV
jgi:hypothetical protein